MKTKKRNYNPIRRSQKSYEDICNKLEKEIDNIMFRDRWNITEKKKEETCVR